MKAIVYTKYGSPDVHQSFFGGPILYGVQVRIDEVAEDNFGKIDLFLSAYSPEVSDTTHLKVLIHSIKIREL